MTWRSPVYIHAKGYSQKFYCKSFKAFETSLLQKDGNNWKAPITNFTCASPALAFILVQFSESDPFSPHTTVYQFSVVFYTVHFCSQLLNFQLSASKYWKYNHFTQLVFLHLLSGSMLKNSSHLTYLLNGCGLLHIFSSAGAWFCQ